MTDTTQRLAELERHVLGRATITDADRAHPAGSGCWFCGLSFAVEADETGRLWFPHTPNEANDTCLGCFLDAHELGFADTEWRTDTQHRDVVVGRLVGRSPGTWEPGIADRVEWRWFHELPDAEPHPTARFAWADLAELCVRADPPEHVCDDGCPPDHAELLRLRPHRSPGVTFGGYRTRGAAALLSDPVFNRGPLVGRPARFDRKADEWVPA